MGVSALALALFVPTKFPDLPLPNLEAKHSGPPTSKRLSVRARQRRPNLDGRWQFRAGVGEIPVLAGSFKLALELGYHFNDYLYLGGIIQLRDQLERNRESWNAERIGLQGLRDSREQTGVRVFLGSRLRPHRYAPYLAAGLIFNGSDREAMRFDAREREIGLGRYTGDFTILQRRPFAIRPAVGLGYSVELARGLSLGVEFTGAWFFRAPTPEVEMLANGFSLVPSDKTVLVERIEKVFADNWHNRYHLFLLSAGYTF